MKGLLKRQKRKKSPKVKKEMECPKAYRIGRRKSEESTKTQKK
jgi:hypothetical protein